MEGRRLNFEDEHYVRVYTRDTKTWKRLGFEGQTVLMHVLRRLDKAGVLDDIEDPVIDVALVTDVPEVFVAVGLPRLFACGVLEHRGNCIVMPRYIEGQTARKSDAARSRDARQKRRAVAMSASRKVTSESREQEKAPHRDAVELIQTQDQETQEASPASRNVTCESRDASNRHDTTRDSHAIACAEQRSATQLLPTREAAAESRTLKQRAQSILDNPHDATWNEPKYWPEVLEVAQALSEAQGRSELRLLSYAQDSGIKRLVELFAAGYSVDELCFAVRSSWFVEGRRNLRQLSNVVVDRAREPAPEASARPATIEVTGRDAQWT